MFALYSRNQTSHITIGCNGSGKGIFLFFFETIYLCSFLIIWELLQISFLYFCPRNFYINTKCYISKTNLFSQQKKTQKCQYGMTSIVSSKSLHRHRKVSSINSWTSVTRTRRKFDGKWVSFYTWKYPIQIDDVDHLVGKNTANILFFSLPQHKMKTTKIAKKEWSDQLLTHQLYPHLLQPMTLQRTVRKPEKICVFAASITLQQIKLESRKSCMELGQLTLLCGII